MILNRHHHLPKVETHRSVPLPFRSGPAVRTLFAKKAKNEDCANRHVPSANDRFLIGTRHKCHRSLVNSHSHYSRCRSTSIIVSPNPIGPAVQTVFPKRLKIKCANRHVPSATNRFSMGTVIFPRSKTSISASPCCDRTSRSNIIRERAKNKDCANRNRHVPSATDRLSYS